MGCHGHPASGSQHCGFEAWLRNSIQKVIATAIVYNSNSTSSNTHNSISHVGCNGNNYRRATLTVIVASSYDNSSRKRNSNGQLEALSLALWTLGLGS